ncbi:ribonuclease HII [Bauldia sp.]|uniref:ribonuclease HII n=1 Tax=Bauldia sp. TaxID=2575872 RepID=UPI003BAB68A5
MSKPPADSPPLIDLPKPTNRIEKRARRRGARLIAGVDEAGRGPLAGPVVVAAVIFEGRVPSGLDDSKRLAAEERSRLHDTILRRAIVSVAVASRARIDRMNILQASLWGMSKAVAGLARRPDHVLVDGNLLPRDLPCPGEAVIGGDALSVSIAAASIVAKVTRDRLMAAVGRAYPDYGFGSHKGYSTRDHFAALDTHGPCIHHRRSFAPVRIALGLEAEQIELFADKASDAEANPAGPAPTEPAFADQ